MDFLAELWRFMRVRKKFWLLPILVMMVVFGGLVILTKGSAVAPAQEERFTRKKHDSSFPKNAIEYCLKEGGVSLNELDAVVFYDKPFLKFERLIETYLQMAPRG